MPKSPPISHTDEELLKLMLIGDESAFVMLYRRWQGNIYRFALRMCGVDAYAEDITQEVFMALMRDGSRFDATRGTVGSFLYGIARNHVLRRIEREKPYVPIENDEEDEKGGSLIHDKLILHTDPLGDLSRSETIQHVREAILSLPPRYREVVVLCQLHELNYADAANVLGCPIGTVRSRLHRARALLIERLRNPTERQAEIEQATSARCSL